jgi:glycerol-3-phosphate dehydrogenase (NAD(P)+)
LWAREPEVAEDIQVNHRNTMFLKGVELPESIKGTSNPVAALAGAQLVILAVPAQVARKALEPMAELIEPDAIVACLMKGVELGTGKLMTQVASEALQVPDDRIVAISGPNLATEVAQQQPAATVVASTNPAAAAFVAEACQNSYFRPYTNDDVVGVELCGAIKNVIALAVGIAFGAGYGWNTIATLVTRGLAEITRLGLALGAKPATFMGLAGMGDLTATCASPLSRNHSLGERIGRGMSLEEALPATGGTAEGVKSSESVLELAQSLGVDMPITAAVVGVLTGKIKVDDLAPLLLNRPRKAEGE